MALVPEPIYPEPIEIDPELFQDEGYGENNASDLVSFTTSLSQSVTAYPYENGRRYHAFRAGSYFLPNDDEELRRLNVVHKMVKRILDDRLFLAPLPSDLSGRILDIGTGTGIWAMEMGDLYPGAEIIGNDLSPVQPSWVPPNVRFEVDDAESEWAYSKPFDFVFSRYMCGSVLDWPSLVKQAFDNVTPGGWAEFQDFDLRVYAEDGSLAEGSCVSMFMKLLVDAVKSLGREPSPGPKLDGWLKEAGFVRVWSRKFQVPIGPWAKDQRLKEAGRLNLTQFLDGLEAISLRIFTNILKWQVEEIQVLCAKVKSELKRKSVHAIMDFHVVYGQRPPEPTQ